MSHTENTTDRESIENKLNELVREIGGQPPRRRPVGSVEQRRDDRKQFQKKPNTLRESLDYLRVCIKYQLFDLEATRRENKYLRGLLEGKDA